ncbi:MULTISPECIES: VCBS repeat-containing protein [unclassified Frankia]|uniref:FG-GAP repeat domain-containing protein n=1 Tax=unclassified Frankia TaxID=2632575 RepID=UPI002AD42F14|nr:MULTISPECIES: VCBS repeat-containing protein [unclassified Frankia]
MSWALPFDDQSCFGGKMTCGKTVERSAPGRFGTCLLGLAVLLVGAGLTIFGPTNQALATAKKANRIILSGSSWLSGKGVDVYSNDHSYSSDLNDKNYVDIGPAGQPKSVLSGLRWQCVELVNRLYLVRGWITKNWSGDGYQMYDTAPKNLSKDSNGSIAGVGAGDVLVFGGGMGGKGHVAVVESVSGTGDKVSVSTVSQNLSDKNDGVWSTFSWDKKQKKITPLSGYTTIGVVHAPVAQPARPGTRLLADVNGDGRSDAIVMFRDSGVAMVALAQADGRFGAPQSWAFGHTVGADTYFAADVDGDRRADLIAFWASTGRWRVSLSSGSGFWPETDWAYGHGVGTNRQWVADVTGDGRADVVTFDAANGDWWVSASSGSGFWSPQRWISGHGVGTTDQALADFTGDGRADAGVYIAGGGDWYVAASTGNGFSYPPRWSVGHGLSSTSRLVGDVNGDKRADAAYFFAANGHWDVGTSSGSGFWAPTAWANGHGIGTNEQFLADVTGDGKADVVTFDEVNGDWWVSVSSGSGFWPPQRWISGHGAGS